MSDVAIRVEGLGKRFRLRHQSGGPRYRTLREDLLTAPRALWTRLRRRRIEQEEFWALRDVSFEVKRGEVLGVIGRNGAGKSTLLKILSRIMDPTYGEATVYGRVGSLLEVGTGFHPELTGRENIYLSGALLGMKRAEVRRCFDEIVEFAGVEKFLDTPCKHYSSGMYARLGFAVAAHLGTEILLIDEVLAVGDAEFQRRCVGKMGEVAAGGRTVLFVSHNLGTVHEICSRAICLGSGGILGSGNVNHVVSLYVGQKTQASEACFPRKNDKPSITRVSVDEASALVGDLVIEIEFESPFRLSPPVPGILVTSASGIPVYGSNIRMHPVVEKFSPTERGVLKLIARGIPLFAGSYQLSVWLSDWHTDYDQRRDALSFEFRRGHEVALKPPESVSGSLDWRAVWTCQNG